MKSTELTELCHIAFKYGTDKCPQLKHSYTPFYYNLLNKKRESIKKVLEIGIGHYKNMNKRDIVYDKGLRRHYHKGASLKMWRDFFPNAMIYGADIVPESMFEEDRIKTFICDETKKEDLEGLIKKVGTDIDLLIDDASHRTHHQIFCFQTLMPLLNKDVIYIIEDITHSRAIIRAINEPNYHIEIPDIPRKSRDGRLMMITKKSN